MFNNYWLLWYHSSEFYDCFAQQIFVKSLFILVVLGFLIGITNQFLIALEKLEAESLLCLSVNTQKIFLQLFSFDLKFIAVVITFNMFEYVFGVICLFNNINDFTQPFF